MQFPTSILNDLTTAGWFPNRKIDISDIVQNQDAPEIVTRVLSEMRGLLVPQRNYPDGSTPVVFINFDPKLPSEYDECIDELQQRTKESIFPLAESEGGYDEYYIGSSGKVYSCNTAIGRYYIEGNTFEEALENMILRTKQSTQLFKTDKTE